MRHDLVVAGKVASTAGVEELEVGITDGVVAEVRRQGLSGARIIRTGRGVIFPGFVDIHVHLREPGWERKEDFRTGSEAAIHGGVTTVADMPNNPVPATTPRALKEKMRLSAKALVDVRFYGGVAGDAVKELSKMADLVVAYKLYLAESTGSTAFPTEELESAFATVEEAGRPASLHCEDQGVIDRETERLAGVARADVYADVRPPEAEVASVMTVLDALKRASGARANICHASTAETLDLVLRAKGEGLRVECEAALHHLYYSRKAMEENRFLRTNPPLRSEEDREALLAGLSDGAVSFLVTDHAPHLEEEKLDGASGIPGLDDYGHLVAWLIRKAEVAPQTVVRAACANPSSFIGLQDRGDLSVGRRGDIAVVDLHSPEVVSDESVRSKCGWSPYTGREFPGRVRWTIRGGEVLLDDYEQLT